MILIIDNEKSKRDEYVKKLKGEGVLSYACSEAESASLLEKYRFHLILLINTKSLEAPITVCENLKKAYPKIPLVILATDESENELQSLNAHADNIILPKSSLKKCIPIIMEYIRIFFGRSRTDMIYKSVRIELYGKAVYVFGSRFDATKNDYAILRYLTIAEGEVSVEELRTFCFDSKNGISTHGVIAAISRINQKAKKEFGRKIIQPTKNQKYIIAI
jgi:DNA-binding response OmpR family regulator